jgi:hypothetical protein
MREDETGKNVARLLDHSLDNLKQSTLNRLQAVRRAALDNYQMADARVSVRVGQGASARGGHEWQLKTRKVLSAIALLLALAGIVYWQTLQRIDENEEIDIMLLVDELPVNAYLDNELDAWLDPS